MHVKTIYRYRPLTSYVYNELKYGEIYLANRTELNDPLDISSWAYLFFEDKSDVENFLEYILEKESIFRLTDSSHHSQIEECHKPDYQKELMRVIEAFPKFPNQNAFDESQIGDLLKSGFDIESGAHLIFKSNIVNSMKEDFESVFGCGRVASFSKTHENFMMWSLYAERHSGICIEYEVDPTYTSRFKFKVLDGTHFNYRPNQYVTLHPVDYDNRKGGCVFELFNQLRKFIASANFSDDIETARNVSILEGVFSHKMERWSGEGEYRIIKVDFEMKSNFPEAHIISIPMENIKSVYLGPLISKQNLERLHYVREHFIPHLELIQMRIDKRGHFSMEPIKG